MATKEPQTRRAFGEQGVSRWLPALACFARKAGARSVGAETPELDEYQKSERLVGSRLLRHARAGAPSHPNISLAGRPEREPDSTDVPQGDDHREDQPAVENTS